LPPELLSELTEEELQEYEARLLRNEAFELSDDLGSFVQEAWKILEPVTPLSWNWHHELICEYLTLVKENKFKEKFGPDCEGIIFNVPPRTMKSLLISVFFPCWLWTSDPARRWMFASYAEKLSTQHSVFRRNVMRSAWYQERWGHVFSFAKDQDLKTHYENSNRGQMFATAMQSAATGMGGDVLVFDDPLNPEQALSEAEREGVNIKFDTTFRSRLNDPAKGIKIIVMQRLHELDLTGHVLSKESSRWKHVKLPAIAETQERWEFPISGRVVERKPNELLWPERLTETQLAGMKVGMGSWAFAGQYQQNPAPMEGGIVKRNWIKFYKELPERFDLMVISADCTFKGASKSAKQKSDIDFVAIQAWGKCGGKYYMMPHRIHERLDFGPSRDAIKSFRARFPQAHAILIEDKANGPAIISELQKELPGVVAIEPEGGKLSRFQSTSPLWEAGSIELPDPHVFDLPWVEEYIHNICTFPKAAHDDDADSTSQALIYIRHKMGGGIMDFYRKGAAEIKVQQNIARGLPPKKGAHVVETRLTQVVKNWAANPGSTFLCSKSQYPEVRQALLDIGSDEAIKEVKRLDEQHGWGTA
jgi:predicted phage terminase large subunit-like protein